MQSIKDHMNGHMAAHIVFDPPWAWSPEEQLKIYILSICQMLMQYLKDILMLTYSDIPYANVCVS